MASLVAIKSDHVKPGQSAVEGLREKLRERGVGNAGPAGPLQTSALPPHVLQQIQRASEKSSSRGTTPMLTGDDARKGVNFQSGESSDRAGSKVLLGQRSLPTPQCTPLKGARTFPAPGAVGGVRKRRTRPSKKPPTTIVEAKPTDFRDVVQTLTGGTFCSQASVAASPTVSTPSVTRNSPEIPGSAPVRPQPSRPNGNGTPSDSVEVPIVPPTTSSSPVSQEQPELPAFLFQGSEGAGGLNDMMGYTGQSSWMAMESAMMATESIGVSSSSQFPAGVYQCEMRKTSVAGYNVSMPFLLEETDISKEGSPYQRDARFATQYWKGARGTDLRPRHLVPEDDSDGIIDSWFNPDSPTLKNMYINQTL